MLRRLKHSENEVIVPKEEEELSPTFPCFIIAWCIVKLKCNITILIFSTVCG
jgi:hypothetical protein